MTVRATRLQTFAVPSATELIDPAVVEGRWLLPEDENAIVINNQVINEEPDIDVGDDITLEIEGVERSWRVVGRIHTAFVGPRMYANYPVSDPPAQRKRACQPGAGNHSTPRRGLPVRLAVLAGRMRSRGAGCGSPHPRHPATCASSARRATES